MVFLSSRGWTSTVLLIVCTLSVVFLNKNTTDIEYSLNECFDVGYCYRHGTTYSRFSLDEGAHTVNEYREGSMFIFMPEANIDKYPIIFEHQIQYSVNERNIGFFILVFLLSLIAMCIIYAASLLAIAFSGARVIHAFSSGGTTLIIISVTAIFSGFVVSINDGWQWQNIMIINAAIAFIVAFTYLFNMIMSVSSKSRMYLATMLILIMFLLFCTKEALAVMLGAQLAIIANIILYFQVVFVIINIYALTMVWHWRRLLLNIYIKSPYFVAAIIVHAGALSTTLKKDVLMNTFMGSIAYVLLTILTCFLIYREVMSANGVVLMKQNAIK